VGGFKVAICDLKRQRPGTAPQVPYAFTEHGAIMAANLLSSPRAIEVSVYVVRAFVRIPERGSARSGTESRHQQDSERFGREVRQP